MAVKPGTVVEVVVVERIFPINEIREILYVLKRERFTGKVLINCSEGGVNSVWTSSPAGPNNSRFDIGR